MKEPDDSGGLAMIPNWKPPVLWQRLLWALLIIAAASAIRAWFFGSMGRGIPYVIYYPAVMLAALYGGLLAGFLATSLSASLCFFWIQKGFMSPVETLGMVIFLLGCALISIVCEVLLRVQTRAKSSQAQTEAANQELRREMAERQRAEVALRETNEYLDNLFNFANAPIIVWDPQFRISRFNHAFEALTGRRADEVLGQSLKILFPPTLVASSMALIKKTTGGERWETVEIPILHLDGSVCTVLWNSATIFAADGKTPVATIAQGHDITERKLAEQALSASETRYRSLFENMQEGYAYCRMRFEDGQPQDFIYLAVNRAFEPLTGLRDVVGKNVSVVIPGIRQSDPELFAAYGRVARTGRPERFEVFVNALERWFSIAVYCPEPEHFVAIFDVITERKQAELALRQSEAVLREGQRLAKLGNWEWNTVTGRHTWSPEIYSIYGRDPELGPAGVPEVSKYFTPGSWAGLSAAVEQGLKDNRAYAYDAEVVRPDGAHRWITARGEALHDASGNVIGLRGTVQDVTDRKRVEVALRDNERLYRGIGESIDYGIWVCAPDGRNTYASESFLRLVGITQEQCSNFGWGAVLHPEDAARAIAAWKECVRTGGNWNIEHRCLGVDGQWHPILARGVPVRNDQGQIICWAGINLDIRQLKQVEAKLRASEEQFRTMANAMPQLAWIAKADGYIFWYNQRWYEYTGTTPAQMEGWGWQSVHDPELLPHVMSKWTESIATGQPFEMEFPLRAADGKFHTFLTRGQPLKDVSGQVGQWLGTSTDIELLKQTEEKIKRTITDLERSNQELEHFAYVASHDLQEPLRMVASYTQLLEQHFSGQLDDKARKYIHYAVDGAVRMQTLINDLLAYSRVGRRGKPPEPIDAHAVLGEAIRNLATAIEESHAVVTNHDLPTVWADASQLVLVFQNLLANAIKFRRAELPRIHVSARREGDAWLFAVKDNGIGIEAQYAERVFVIFQRLHTRAEYPGTGIGLAICKRIVERHGGRIWFKSSPGNGTTFFFTIPANQPKQADETH